MAFRGALVYLGSSVTVNSGVRTMIPYNRVVYDTDGFFNPAQPTRLTVPSGVTKVRLATSHIWYNNANGLRQAVVKKNSASSDGFYPGCGPATIPANSSTTTDPHAVTAVIDVNEGDYFESEAGQWSGSPLTMAVDANGESRGTWFMIEVMEEGVTTPPDPDGFQEVFAQTLETSMGAWPNQTFVGRIKRSSLSNLPANPTTEIELTFKGGAYGFGTDGAYVALAPSSGDAYDFPASGVGQLKSNGNGSFVIPANGTLAVKAPFVDDGVSDIVFAIQHDGSSANSLVVHVGSGNVFKGYYKAGKDAATIDKSGYAPLGNSDALNQHCLVSKIRMDGF